MIGSPSLNDLLPETNPLIDPLDEGRHFEMTGTPRGDCPVVVEVDLVEDVEVSVSAPPPNPNKLMVTPLMNEEESDQSRMNRS